MIVEQERNAVSGLAMLLVLPLALIADVAWLVRSVAAGNVPLIIAAALVLAALVVAACGFFIVNPNEGKVLQLFGAYRGTAKHPGLRWANPFFSKRKISMRVRNFETARMKVNDQRGNPIEIAAVVVWKVVDSAEAVFQVDDYDNYVHVQSESALRNLATGYPYDAQGGTEVDLVGHGAEVSAQLQREIQDRLAQAGVAVIEARISHLAYAPEIASAMLQRQQAGAVVAARSRIVEGAVGMVEMALEMLAEKQVVSLDEERKAAMVSNLLVVLCSDRHTQPVVNAGTLHH